MIYRNLLIRHQIACEMFQLFPECKLKSVVSLLVHWHELADVIFEQMTYFESNNTRLIIVLDCFKACYLEQFYY